MKGFNRVVNWNFKKIFIIYLIITVVCGVFAAAAVGYVFRDKISLAYHFEKASEAFEHADADKIRGSIDALAASSADITDVLILGDDNSVIYSAKGTNLARGDLFELKKSEDGGRFLVSDADSDAVFRFAKKDEFMLRSVFADDFEKIHDEYDEDSFYRNGYDSKNLYILSVLGKKDGKKAYVISDPTPSAYGMTVLKAAASLAMLLFMLYWVIIALWVYSAAAKSRLSAPVWGIITLFANLAGALIFVIYKHINRVCAHCGAVQPRGNVFCAYCGKKIGTTCSKCGAVLRDGDNFCPRCSTAKQK